MVTRNPSQAAIGVREREQEYLRRGWSSHFEDMIEPISIHDRDFRVVCANRAFTGLLGLNQEAVLGSRCHKLVHELHSPCRGCPMQRMFADGNAGSCELAEERLKRVIHVTVSPIRDDNGGVVGAVHVVHDMTDVHRAQQLEREQEKLRTALEMAGAMAHELNQPLTVVLGYAELLSRSLDQEGAPGRRAQEIYEQALRMRESMHGMKQLQAYRTRDYVGGQPITELHPEVDPKGKDAE